jgi:chemotaxis protein histidine kinase CheA
VSVDPLIRPLLPTFRSEAETIQQRVTRALLELERTDIGAADMDPAATEVTRGLHTLKGTAATFGLARMSELMHALEDLLGQRRELAGGTIEPDVADAMLKVLDIFVEALRHLIRDADAEPDLHKAFELIERATRGDPGATTSGNLATTTGSTTSATGDVAAPMDVQEEIGSWRVDEKNVGFLLADTERLREMALRIDERISEIDATLGTVAQAKGAGALLESVRTQLGSVRRALAHDLEEIGDVVASMEDGLRAICTLPVATILEPLRRLVRDYCRQSGKRATLSIVGGELSLDRRQLESLRGPLVQLVRNAVDHGIEAPDARDSAGKFEQGAITIRVEQQGNVLFVEVADDGRGIDVDAVCAEALRRGLIREEEIPGMERREVYELLFSSGLSTASAVTEASGRGVGLDIVREQLRTLRGQIDVLSEAGQGTRFVITIPAELGSSPTLVLRVGEALLGLPMVVVESVVLAKSVGPRLVDGPTVLEHRERKLPVQDLGALLALRSPTALGRGQTVMVVQSQGKHAAVAVDEIVADRELVIRPLPEELRRLRAYQGVATLGRGEVLLILRPDWLVDQQERRLETGRVRKVLVADDSITARAMHRTALESGGFVVHTAASGAQALEALEAAPYDALVCDLHMEGLDGLDVLRALRQRDRTRGLPVILVTVDDDDATSRAAFAAGADSFLPKRACAAGRLLAEVEAVMARRKSA